MHCLHEKPVEVKRAVPRDQMAAATAAAAQAAAAATVRAAAAAAAASASASAPLRNCWEPPLSSSGGGFNLPSRSSLPHSRPPHEAEYFGGGGACGGGGGLATGPGFAGGSLAAELEALSFHHGGGEDFYRPQSPYNGGGGVGSGNAPFDRSAFEDAATERNAAATAAAADDSGLVAFLARQQQQQHHGNGTASAALSFAKLHHRHQEAPAPSSTHSLSPPEGSRYRSLYSDVFGPPASTSSAVSAVAGFSSSEAASSGGEGGGRNSSGEHQRDEERYGRGFEFFPAAPRSGGTLSPYSDSLGAAFGGYGEGNGKAGEW